MNDRFIPNAFYTDNTQVDQSLNRLRFVVPDDDGSVFPPFPVRFCDTELGTATERFFSPVSVAAT